MIFTGLALVSYRRAELRSLKDKIPKDSYLVLSEELDRFESAIKSEWAFMNKISDGNEKL